MYVSEKGLERDTDPDTVTSVWKTDTFPLRQSRMELKQGFEPRAY